MSKRKGQGKTGEISLYVVVDGGGQATLDDLTSSHSGSCLAFLLLVPVVSGPASVTLRRACLNHPTRNRQPSHTVHAQPVARKHSLVRFSLSLVKKLVVYINDIDHLIQRPPRERIVGGKQPSLFPRSVPHSTVTKYLTYRRSFTRDDRTIIPPRCRSVMLFQTTRYARLLANLDLEVAWVPRD
jgi:hypothetical protein